MITSMQFKKEDGQTAIQKDIMKDFTKFIQQFYVQTEKIVQDDRNNRRTIKQKKFIYYEMAKGLCNQDRSNNPKFCVLNVVTEHLYNYNYDLATAVLDDFYKYEKCVNAALTQLMIQILKQYQEESDESQQKNKQKFYVSFSSGRTGANELQIGLRDLKSSKIGKLQTLMGTVIRTTQIRPQLIAGVFRCRNCNKQSSPIIQQFRYVQPKKCLNYNCDSKNWQIVQKKSQFADFQQVRIQEDPNSIPPGGMPRSLNVILRNYNVQKAQPGDICKFIGYLCVSPDINSMLRPGQRTTLSTRSTETRGNGMQMDGVKGITGVRQLNYKFVFMANNVIVKNKQYHEIQNTIQDQNQQAQKINQNDKNAQKKSYHSNIIYDKIFKNLTPSETEEISQIRNNPRLYDELSESMFPGIYGHSQIKKAILLQLFSGVHKVTTKNKISIRGDINVLLVGDPSTAKSQFLKTVNKFVPRSVYTNGKTTSAAGLTASVVRDSQGNVGIEAGALMLADNGVCCIDQFDKMNLSDMTAIHQAMEQQTISIAKAGVHATLNARTSVLAAANPVFGRYDKSKNLQQNINISPPIMSRFDLCFVICDDANIQADNQLCQFMIKMHRDKETTQTPKKYNNKSLRFYMGIAKKLKPMLTYEAAQKLRQCYLKIRQASKSGESSYKATVRQLQSMIRLSQALARLHLTLQVGAHHVQQAYRLIMNSITRLKKADIILEQEPQLKQNMRVQNFIDEQLKKKEQQRKQKQITITNEVYKDICTNVLNLFKEQMKVKKESNIDIQSQIKLSQGNLINYVISIEVQKNTIQTEDQQRNFRKIVKAVIKKMIKDERILMIEEDDINQNQRILKIHPNHYMD